MHYPKAKWLWTEESEANRVLQTCAALANGFFHLNGFFVLSPEYMERSTKTVILPTLKYSSIPEFWSKCAAVQLGELPLKGHSELIHDIHRQLIPLHLTSPLSLELDWHTIEDEFWDKLNAIIPNLIKQIKSITIYPTHFGTGGSFNSIHKDQIDIVIYPRSDRGIETIAELILSSLSRRELETNHNANWGETEIIVDWLLHDSSLSELFPDNLGTLAALRQPTSSNLLLQSREFLVKIGAPNFNHPFTIHKDIPHFNNNPLHNLTKRESTMLISLINHAPNTLTYDELSELIFTNEESYSLAALTKAIDRLRDKLTQNGINRNFITTERDRGYYLKVR